MIAKRLKLFASTASRTLRRAQVPGDLYRWESPPYGHGGFPREVVVEMCIALMQHLSAEGSKITKRL